MLNRLFRSAIVFAAIFAAYEAYALLAVPWMEPPLAVRPGKRPTQPDLDKGRAIATTHQLLLSNYFPKDHWTQTLPPKVFASSNGQAMLVLDAYERVDNAASSNPANAAAKPARGVEIKIDRFALLIFPTPPREGVTAPQDAIILEAQQGARLEFDEFRPEHGKIGQITRGEFPGRIIIRSAMHDPGPEDDLLVETADLQMNPRLMFTPQPVRFRMGPNVGIGRELEIRFLADEHVQPQDSGLKFAGIDSLEIRREVRMRLQLETDSLLPGGQTTSSQAEHGNEEAQRGNEKKPNPPVEVSCSGPFHFDFVQYRASVDGDVLLRQINPNGPSDQITCNQLDIHFAPQPLVVGQPDPVVIDASKRQQRDLGRLEPAVIVAKGHPVVVTSPARNAEARGETIQIGLPERRVTISGDREVSLVYGPNVLRAPAIDYQHPAPQAATSIGSFRASGPGSLFYLPDPAKPEQVLHAFWQRLADLGREGGQPVLTLDGRPQLAFAAAGAVTADGIKVYLRELQGDGGARFGLPVSGGKSGIGRLQMVPDRLAAKGRVEIQSLQLNGRTSELLTTFCMQSAEFASSSPATSTPASSAPSAAPGSLASQVDLSPASTPANQSFHIDADQIQIQVQLKERSAAPSTVVCDGNVLLREVPLAQTTEQPFEIRGGRLTVDQLDTGTAHIILTGPQSAGVSGSRQVQLAGRGVTMLADIVELDQRDNRLWSNGPGKATLLVTRDLNGRESSTPMPLEVSWQGGLEFDGRNIVFRRNVVVAGIDDTLRCDQLSTKLTSPVKFGERIDQQSIGVEEVDCQGNASLDHRTRDETGVISHERMQLPRIIINLRTGAFSGEGPGALRSTRFGTGLETLIGPQATSPLQNVAAPPPRVAGSKLYFLGVDFQRSLSGLIYTRELTLYERVRTVYGPVDAWEQELDVNRPETLPPDCVRLLCDELRVNEDPLAARLAAGTNNTDKRQLGKIQLQAQYNVRIDGHSAEHGSFVAQADRASYEESKDVFLLEGGPRTPATIWFNGHTGTPQAVRKITFVRSTGRIDLDAIYYLEFTPNSLENASRGGALRQ